MYGILQISIEDVKERQERHAKMRDLLFRHEMKAKRVKKIKSKTYHRLLKKDKAKAAEASFRMDPELAKAHAMKTEFRRAEVTFLYLSYLAMISDFFFGFDDIFSLFPVVSAFLI